MKRFKKIAVLTSVLILVGLLCACGKNKEKEKSDKAEETTSLSEANPENLDDITMDGLVSDLMKDMTLEEKIGQMFIVCTDSLDFNAETQMTKAMKNNIQKYKPGGVIFFSYNIKNRKQVKKFIKKLQKNSSIPMFISVDEEGGAVARIGNTKSMKTTKFPSMYQIGLTGDSQKAYEVGKTIGMDIKALGFNLDFAPVSDITTNKDNTEIGERSFGTDAELVADMVSEEVKGLQENGVSATLKHFPGQGDTAEDTHKGYSDIGVTIDRLRDVEFVPFVKGIEAGADFIMMSHVAVSSVTQSEVPASLSSLMVHDILREELTYDNVIITDAMNMKVITKFYDSGQAAVMAVEAGNDMILMPDDFESAYQGVLDAVNDGTISSSQIDDAVARILKIKIKRGVIPLNSVLLETQQ